MTTAERLERAAAALEAARLDRDELICRMRSEGATIRQIAARAGITPQGVSQVLRHRTTAK